MELSFRRTLHPCPRQALRGYTALMVAARHGRVECFTELLQRDADKVPLSGFAHVPALSLGRQQDASTDSTCCGME